MNKIKNTINIAFIASFVMGGFYLLSGGIIAASISVILGIYYQSLLKLDYNELKNKKTINLLIAFISLLPNMVGSIAMFMAIDNLENLEDKTINGPPKKRVKTINPRIKKLDLLLKLGSVMILISGLIFSTTTWELYPILKTFLCFLLGIIFIGLSIFSEKKLKIKETTNMYYIIAIGFFMLSYYTIGYLEVISNYFSLFGEGSNLYLSTLYIVLALGTYFLDQKFNNNIIKNITSFLLTVALVTFICFFEIDNIYIFILLNLICLGVNFVFKNNKFTIPSIVIAISSALCVTNNSLINDSEIIALTLNNCLLGMLIISVILNLLSSNYLKKKFYYITNAILINILTIEILSLLIYNNDVEIVLYYLISSFTYLFLIFTPYFKTNKDFIKPYIIVTNIILLFSTMFMASLSSELALLSTAVILLTNIISIYKIKEIKLEQFLQPIKIILLFLTIIQFTNIDSSWINFSLILIFYILFRCSNNNLLRKIYLFFGIGSLLLTFINYNDIYALCATTAMSLFYYLEAKEKHRPFMFAVILLLINLTFSNMFYGAEILSNIIILVIFTILVLINKNNIKEQKIANLALLIPVYGIINNINVDYEIMYVVDFSFFIFLIYLINKLFIKLDKNKNLFVSIGLGIITLSYIFNAQLLMALSIGLVGLIAIIIYFNNENYKGLFYYGIISTILNIIIQLGELWQVIPFWAYLLALGLTIIAFSTIKLMKEPEKK